MKLEKIVPDYGAPPTVITIYYTGGVVHIVSRHVTAVGTHEDKLVIRDTGGGEPYIFECDTPERAQEQADVLRLRVRTAYEVAR